jgi:hypothetical protein
MTRLLGRFTVATALSPRLRHTIMFGFCLWAMHVQVTYRVPSRFVFVALPWLGTMCTILCAVFFLRERLAPGDGDGTFQRTAALLEGWGSAVIVVFLYSSLLLYVNARLDRSPPLEYPTRVERLSGFDLDTGLPLAYSWLELRSWVSPGRTERVILGPGEHRDRWGGEAVRVRIRRGALGLAWISSLQRDQEFYLKAILHVTPASGAALSKLVEFYVERGLWTEAADSARRYLALYPDAIDFALWAGQVLKAHGAYDAAMPFLEFVVARRPTRFAAFQLAWAFGESAHLAEAVAAARAGVAREPQAWELHHLIGVYSARMGRCREALAAFRRVHHLGINVPGIATTESELRRDCGSVESARR